MGNKLGWVIGGIFATAVVLILVKVLAYPAPSDPTSATVGAGKLTLQRPGESVRLVLGEEPSGAGNAGEDYHRAIALYAENAEAIMAAYRDFKSRNPASLSDQQVRLLKTVSDTIAPGTAKKDMQYYFLKTPKTIEIPYIPLEARRLQQIAEVDLALAEHYLNAKDFPQAERHARALFTVGWHLMNERARLPLVLRGQGLQDLACDWLKMIYAAWGKADRVNQVESYKMGLLPLASVYGNHYRQVLRKAVPRAGDVFNLAENHADRAVRADALIWLGVVKLGAATRGDRRYCAKLIRAGLRSGDEIERAAAHAADALDAKGINALSNEQLWPEEYRR